MVCTGAELEVGWLPMLLRQGANARVQPGSPGYFEAAQYVRLLEVPTRLDRAEGDIHAAGNPHIQTDPRNIAAVAAALAPRMQQLDPAGAAAIAARAQNFQARWAAAMQRWTQQAAPLRGIDDRRLPQELGLSRRRGSACARSGRSSPSRASRPAASTWRSSSANGRPGACAA